MDEGDENASDRVDLAELFFGPGTIPTLDDVGGESALRLDDPSAEGIDLYTVALVLCRSWSSINEKELAHSWLTQAVPRLEPDELVTFNDVALGSSDAIAELVPTLVAAWRALAQESTGIVGNIALEGWTRLAIGQWANNLPLRGALTERAERVVAAEAEADVFLIRAIGAALGQWQDDELEDLLGRLAEDDAVECDIAFELGMATMRRALEEADVPAAINQLGFARLRFDQACLEEERPDAVAFATACSAVADFLSGRPVDADAVAAVEQASGEWLMGYLSESPHWRQPRAETSGAWAHLVRDLRNVRELDAAAWFEPPRLLADVGHLYTAYNSSMLLAMPTVLHRDSGDSVEAMAPIPIALGPRLDSALGASESTRHLLDVWLETVADRLDDSATDAVEALSNARERLRQGGPAPGKPAASREDDDVPVALREALCDIVGQEAYDVIAKATKTDPRLARLTSPPHSPGTQEVIPLAEDRLLSRLLRDLRDVLPEEFTAWQGQLSYLLPPLLRIIKQAINRAQGGRRSYPWHRDDARDNPYEHTLADHLADMLQMVPGLDTQVEAANRAGGDADVLIQYGREQFVIEVKRITAQADDDKLTDNYGTQASQYTLTGPPFAFLAVLDLTKWTTRLSLDRSFWVTRWVDPTTGEVRALTSMRVLADVDSPSVSSR